MVAARRGEGAAMDKDCRRVLISLLRAGAMAHASSRPCAPAAASTDQDGAGRRQSVLSACLHFVGNRRSIDGEEEEDGGAGSRRG